jgi:hypothetical protein
MSLKYEIDSLDGLDETTTKLYTAQGAKFRLAVDGIPQGEDVSGLKSKVEELLAESKKAKEDKRLAEEAARKAAEEAARQSGDVGALEKSWQEKLAAREAELSQSISQRDAQLQTLLVDNVAHALASELAVSGSAQLLLPHIARRLKVEVVDGVPITRVLDASGKPSAATVDELKKEFTDNKAFAPVIVGSRASGGGAAGASGGGGAGTKRFADLTEAERVALYRESPEKYAQYKADHP